jgi:uncharacterized phage protein gp47/JayE
MPWQTPTLKDVRSLVRDQIRGSLPGADATIPNSVLRVLSDSQGALCHLTLQFIDWLTLQLIPDTAEHEWLDRHGDIWLVNADGTTGRKMATLASGVVNFFVTAPGVVIPSGTQLSSNQFIGYETTQLVVATGPDVPIPAPIRALDPGSAGNLDAGSPLSVETPITNLITEATVLALDGGTDEETDDELRFRVLARIRQPPQGGAAHDYVIWSLAVPGCTRAWVSPLEMGIGTVTVRVIFDDLRADDDGWPQAVDLNAVATYIDTVRPVAVKDFWVLAPIKQRVDVLIKIIDPDTTEIRAAVEANLKDMFFEQAAPGQTIFAAWKVQAIMNTANVRSVELLNYDDDMMASPGHMAVLGDIQYSF